MRRLCFAQSPGKSASPIELIQIIVKGLDDCGVLTRRGRSNLYRIDTDVPPRHPLENDRTVGELLAFLLSEPEMAWVRRRKMKSPPSRTSQA